MNIYLDKLAKVLINYSLELKPNKLLKIDAEPESLPLVKAVYKEALRRDILQKRQ
jgi:leucyl aminopeptidase (aminopeptidase T)